MAFSCVNEAVDGPAILQLHKWSPSAPQLNLSEFREAFISPTRELLLLLSYHCEALLIPLITGESMNTDSPSSCTLENHQDSTSSLNFQSSVLTASSRSDSLDEIPSTSEAVENVSYRESPLYRGSHSSESLLILLKWAVAGCAATVGSYPFDLLRTILASQGEPKVYPSMSSSFVDIVRTRGFQGLYAGLTPTLVEIIPYAGLQFGTYDTFKRWTMGWNRFRS